MNTPLHLLIKKGQVSTFLSSPPSHVQTAALPTSTPLHLRTNPLPVSERNTAAEGRGAILLLQNHCSNPRFVLCKLQTHTAEMGEMSISKNINDMSIRVLRRILQLLQVISLFQFQRAKDCH